MSKRKRKNEGKTENETHGSKKEVVVKYFGVTKSGRGYLAQIFIEAKRQYLGTFDTCNEAAKAYDRAAIQAGRSICKLNFQDKIPKNYIAKKEKLSKNNTIGYRGTLLFYFVVYFI